MIVMFIHQSVVHMQSDSVSPSASIPYRIPNRDLVDTYMHKLMLGVVCTD